MEKKKNRAEEAQGGDCEALLGRRAFLRFFAGATLALTAGCGGGGNTGVSSGSRNYKVRFLFSGGGKSRPTTGKDAAGVNGEVGKWYGILNNAGDVLALGSIGTFGTPNFVPAYIYRDGQQIDTGLRNVASMNYFVPPPRWYDMNDLSQVAVTQYPKVKEGDFTTRGLFWDKGAETDLGNMGDGWVFATSMNNAKQVVARQTLSSEEADVQLHWLWQDGQRTLLTPFHGECINNKGQIAGMIKDKPALWEAGKITELPPTDGVVTDVSFMRLNNEGQVISNFFSPETKHFREAVTQPGIWEKGGFRFLSKTGWVYDLNSAGTVVGFGTTSVAVGPDELRAIKWEKGEEIDLNALIPKDSGWVLNQAVDINDNGWIIGLGQYQNQEAAFLLTPV